ncbi:hypothetical protein OAB57_02310 [Bacteriovoracaceae bacterium]|nr:hypothetical protein [Bacteriovoracaceae bacterium]
MQKLILTHPNLNWRNYLRLTIDSHFSFDYVEFENSAGAINYLIQNKESHELPSILAILCLTHNDTIIANDLHHFLNDANIKIPIFLVSKHPDKQDSYFDKLINDGVKNIYPVDLSPTALKKQLNDIIPPNQSLDSAKQYLKLDLQMMAKYPSFGIELLLKLSDRKYVKLKNCDDRINESELESYTQRGIQHLFIHNKSWEEYFNQLYNHLVNQDTSSTDNQNNGDFQSLKTIHEIVQSLGITTFVIKLVDKVIANTISTLKSRKSLHSLLVKLMNNKDYFSGHSLLLSYISCAISIEMGWPSDVLCPKFVTSSLFHDIAFKNKELARIQTLEDPAFINLNIAQKNIVRNHFYRAAELIEDTPYYSFETKNMILDHHERPNGDGFPRKLTNRNTPVTSCVFILAHELAIFLSNNSSYNQIIPHLQHLRSEMCMGNYQKPFQALIRITEKGKPLTPEL